MPYDIYRNGRMEGDEPIITVDSDTLAGTDLYQSDLSDADLRKADLSGADLTDADLSRANLADANLSGANLSAADLTDTNLSGADLTGACLSWSHLTYANLTWADLTKANLTGTNLNHANLTGANLVGVDLRATNLNHANLTGATLTNGETFEYFVQHTVPWLLTAGGKPLEEVASDKNWACHSWRNCPIAVAFRTNNTANVPEEYREAAGLFITLFDAKLIPRPVTTGDNQDAG